MKPLNLLRLDQIRTDGGTQSRVSMNQPTIAEYAELLTDGVAMPPVIVYHDGADFWLAAGFHRYYAHKQVGMVDINCEVRAGSLDEARLCGARDNNSHGLAPNNGDKTKSVTMALANPLCEHWSDRRVAKELGVSHTLVQRVKSSLAPESADTLLHMATVATCNKVSAQAQEKASTPPPAARPAIDAEPAPAERTVPAAATAPPDVPADEHDGDMSTQAELLVEAEQERREALAKVAELEAAMGADDNKAQLLIAIKRADHAIRRQNELMEDAASSRKRADFYERQLGRCGKAVGIRDLDKVAPAVEALARASKVAA